MGRVIPEYSAERLVLALIRGWRWILVGTALALAAAWLSTSMVGRTSLAGGTLEVPLTGGLPHERRLLLVSLARSPEVERAAYERLKGELPPDLQEPERLRAAVDIRGSGTADTVQIRAQADTLGLANTIARAWAQAYVEHINRTYPTLADQQTNAYAQYQEADRALQRFNATSTFDQDSAVLAQKLTLLREVTALRETMSSGVPMRYLTERDLLGRQTVILSDPMARIFAEVPSEASLAVTAQRLEEDVALLRDRVATEGFKSRDLTFRRDFYWDLYKDLTKRIEAARASGTSITVGDINFDPRNATFRPDLVASSTRLLPFAAAAGAAAAAALVVVLDVVALFRLRTAGASEGTGETQQPAGSWPTAVRPTS